jgi:molybdopterin-guanine dinucleotide biosynthesis protein A
LNSNNGPKIAFCQSAATPVHNIKKVLSKSCLHNQAASQPMKQTKPLRVGICVLAGGRSSRMGQDKARLRLGKRTLLGHVRSNSKALGLPVRIIRHDLVSGCGPLGGVLTALKSSQADAELFLACDMPLVSSTFLADLISEFRRHRRPLFVAGVRGAGFPFVLPRSSLQAVEQQLEKKQFSVQALARSLKARFLKPTGCQQHEMLNINTRADFKKAHARWEHPGP